jgi:protein-disulfide isomerase
MCAAAQNRFWQYHDALFESQKQWEALSDPRPVLDSIARVVGVSIPDWTQCYESDRMLPLIMADRDRAARGGVQSTPSFIIGSQVIAGAQPMDVIRPVIDAEVAKNRSGTAP